jgi:protein gp37
MGEQTAISWCDHTKNLWWGCWKIADECANCYADATADRYAPGHWGRTAPRKFFDDKNLNELLKWNRAARKAQVRKRVFVGSMMDWAEIHPVAEINAKMNERRTVFWGLVKQCESLDFLMLTKRPENAAASLPWMASPEDWQGVGVENGKLEQIAEPWANVWLMTTAGTVKSLRRVVPILRSIPAVVRGISCEPLLEGISASEWRDALAPTKDEGPIHWLIVGNESGHKRRPAEMEWVRIARDEAARYGVAFHFKQWVETNGRKTHLPMLDEKQHAAFPEPP